MFKLEDGSKFAVRPSGTEPKMKFYFFVDTSPAKGARLPLEDLPKIKYAAAEKVQALWAGVELDMKSRTA